jgi:hypothetical protein
MNNNILSHYYRNTSNHTFNILGDLKMEIEITANPFQIPLDRLFSMAARINKKRSFLFVSKVLGKHIPVNPYVSLLSGLSLALLLVEKMEGEAPKRFVELAIQGLIDPTMAKAAYEEIMSTKLKISNPIQFIGFAETATAIGHAVYQAFLAPASYIHTSREQIVEMDSSLNFEEEHSHAASHRCYARDTGHFAGKEAIVLVDDEITTGNTSINIIRDIHQKYPRRQYYVLSLLDWRTPEEQQRFLDLEQELDIQIICLSLVKGKIKVTGTPPTLSGESTSVVQAKSTEQSIRVLFLDHCFEHLQVTSRDGQGNRNDAPYLLYSGRFGITSEENRVLDTSITQAAEFLAAQRRGTSTLCMGTGEFMYVPMRIAAEMGEGIVYQSTTRSPIYPSTEGGYAVRSAQAYPSPEDPAVMNFLYNVPPGHYDELFVFMEREVSPAAIGPWVQILLTLGIKNVNLVFCSPKQNNWKEIEQL